MLAGPYPPTHPSSDLFRDAMERRGRSRAVPATTATRKSHRHQRQLYCPRYSANSRSSSLSAPSSPHHLGRSDDSTSPQSTTLEPVTPPELSLDYYESPPSPPQSLEDRIHEAYALDNIHLAKILYLKLQGIHVADDFDPRIEQVREEDFPFGKLTLGDEDESSLKERDDHCKRDQRRATRLAQCERAWDQSIVEYRQQCLLVQRRRAVAVALADRLEEHRSLVQSGPGALSLLSYSSPYDNHSSPVDIPCRSPKSSNLRKELPISSPSQSIPFRQVSACMNGVLFPNDDAPSDLGARKRQSHAHSTLLEVLLQPVTWEREERSEARAGRRNSFPSASTWSSNATLCSTCSTSGSPSTLASSDPERQFAGVRRLTISTPKSTACASSVRTRLSRCGVHSLTPIDLQECPLSLPGCTQPQPNAPPPAQQPKSRSHFASRLVKKIGSSVSTLIDVAAQFQASYLRTAGSIVHFETEYFHEEIAASSWGSRPLTRSAKAKTNAWLPFDPTSPRAKINEITAFIEGSSWSELQEEDICSEQEHYTLVQLLSPSERFLPPPSAPMFPTPSPLRSRNASPSLRCRTRPIANPVLLRLKALQNVCAGQGVEWEGRAREGALGFGRDRLQGIAFDGIGRSRLSWEVSF